MFQSSRVVTGQEEKILEWRQQGEREEELVQGVRPGERSRGPQAPGSHRKAQGGAPAVDRRCAAAFPSRRSCHRRPWGAAPASPGCFSKVQRDYVTRSPSRVENRDIALIYSSTAGAASSQGPPSLSTFTPMPGVGPSPGYRGLPSGAGAQSGSSESVGVDEPLRHCAAASPGERERRGACGGTAPRGAVQGCREQFLKPQTRREGPP